MDAPVEELRDSAMELTDPVVIVSGARTPIGSYGKAFRTVPAHKLAAVAIGAAVDRAAVAPGEVDEVVLGCVGQVGPDAFNARRASLEAGLPERTNAYNVNRLCGSGLQAVWSGATEIYLGQATVVVAGGNENMTRQPMLGFDLKEGRALGDRTLTDGTLSLVTDPWGRYPMGVTAEEVASRYNVTRQEQDEFALRSQQRAARAVEAGLFDEEIVPVTVGNGETVQRDEHPRPQVTLESLSRLRPAFRTPGTVTAGNSSGINDGAAALVLMRASEARNRGLAPFGEIVALGKAALEPEIMGYAPTGAISEVLRRTGLSIEEIGVVELNEAFAAQAIAVIRDAGLHPDRTNPYGGAIALGHPIGATGAILVLKALHIMRRESHQYGLVAMCIGGGQALAMILRNPN
jgi:acetyl-CoA C-acetyltransferase